MHIKSTHYLPIPGFCQKLLNSYFPTNFSPELQKYNSDQIGFDWKLRMLWIWSCPVSTKELFLKIAVPKRQTKFLKSTCEVVSFYYICKLYTLNLLRTIFSQAFLKDFAKITCDFPLYGIVKNLIIYFAEASDIFLIINLPLLSLFLIKLLEQHFSMNTFLWLFQLIHV